jgi:hypothetical protein
MALTGHRGVQTFIGYYRDGEAPNSPAARLMDLKDNEKGTTHNPTATRTPAE